MDSDDTVHNLLLLDTLYNVLVAELKDDGVTTINDPVGLDVDGVEQRWEAVPLCGETIVTLGERDGVLEGAFRVPKGEVLERRAALEELRKLDS